MNDYDVDARDEELAAELLREADEQESLWAAVQRAMQREGQRS